MLTRRATGRQVAFNSLLNLSTGVLILVLNLALVPIVIRNFGLELFGVLSVTWLILANLGWLDFGFSRATARFVAQELAKGELEEGARWCVSAMLSLLGIGLIGGAILFFAAPHLSVLLQVQPSLRSDVTLALRVFAIALPIDLAARSLIGVVQAGQRFAWTNMLDVSATLANFAVYAAAIFLGNDFNVVAWGLFVVRLLNFVISYAGATRVLPSLGRPASLKTALASFGRTARTMVAYGWWLSLAALLGSLLLYFDRWVIGLLLGAGMLTYYAVPMSVLMRLFLVPQSILSTLFPAMSSLHAQADWKTINEFYVRSHRYVLLMVTPALFVLFAWSNELLRLWISPDFAESAAVVLRILVAGFAIALLAPITGSLLEAAGRPDLVAKVYMFQVPLNFVIVYLLTSFYGLAGAAASFALRAFFETVTLWVIAYISLPEMRARHFVAEVKRSAPIVLAMAGAASLVDGRLDSLSAVMATIGVVVLFAAAAWLGVLDQNDRSFLRDGLARVRNRLV